MAVDRDVPGPRRDLRGYGSRPPRVVWPGEAKVAVNLVVNYEEGSEYSKPAGDERNEGQGELNYPMDARYRDLGVESSYEYGSRAGIWRRVFPAATPLDGLETEKLARLNVAGGNIRNIALNAAFLAADAGRAVRMGDLLVAARTECAKIQKTISDAEVRGWL